MQEQFVPYDLALKLKEIHFHENCMAYYDTEKKFYPMGNVLTPDEIYFGLFIPKYQYKKDLEPLIGAPLWQQAFDWFREKHGLNILISPYYNECFYPKIEESNEPPKYFKDDLRITGGFNYEGAKLACLKKLIKIVENEKV